MQSGQNLDAELNQPEIQNQIRENWTQSESQLTSFIELLTPTQLTAYIRIAKHMLEDAREAFEQKKCFEATCANDLASCDPQATFPRQRTMQFQGNLETYQYVTHITSTWVERSRGASDIPPVCEYSRSSTPCIVTPAIPNFDRASKFISALEIRLDKFKCPDIYKDLIHEKQSIAKKNRALETEAAAIHQANQKLGLENNALQQKLTILTTKLQATDTQVHNLQQQNGDQLQMLQDKNQALEASAEKIRLLQEELNALKVTATAKENAELNEKNNKLSAEIKHQHEQHTIENARIPYTEFVTILNSLSTISMRHFTSPQDHKDTRQNLKALAQDHLQQDYVSLDNIQSCIKGSILIELFNDPNKVYQKENGKEALKDTGTMKVVRALGAHFKNHQPMPQRLNNNF